MPSPAHLFAPVALLLTPLPAAIGTASDCAVDAARGDMPAATGEGVDWSMALRIDGPPLLPADAAQPGTLEPETWNQVRIEQHLIIRIAPGPAPRTALLSAPPPAAPPPRAQDRRQLKCVSTGALAGVRLSGTNELTFLLRDAHLVRATLPKICGASAFYSGFYVEPTSDGMLCARRDVIHSRAGANCSISRLDLVDYGN